ncbi:MAG: fructose-1,6-bisphosphatase [Anaerolineae bacterium]|nr:fructose-1,6-bisphosphatase [Anaerolineae bacterium]
MTHEFDAPTLHYLRLLAQQYPTIQAASTEIINLTANLSLPKETEHFLSDIHGEHEAFAHVLRNGSGAIRRRIDEIFGNTLSDFTRSSLATLIYYPEQKLPLILRTVDSHDEWYRLTLFRLIKLCRVMSSKYTRSAVREALPDDFAYIVEELLHEQEGVENRLVYYQSIIDTIIDIGQARVFIIALAELIQRLAITHLHIIGDIYDRGPGAHLIMDMLMQHYAVDVQWGNHDIVWMGAAAGSQACIANVIRVCLRYSNMETLETGYAISILPLVTLAMDVYGDDPCDQFRPKPNPSEEFTDNEIALLSRMHKAIAIIQLKLEGQIIKRRPHYHMGDRLLLHHIDHENGTVTVGETIYPLQDTHFPTIDPDDPYALTEHEKNVIDRLTLSFANSDRLQQHVRFLLAKGSMYLTYNDNLLYHGCIPMHPDGSFMSFDTGSEALQARAFMERIDRWVRQGYFASDPTRKAYGQDAMWYLWCGPVSPIFGKDKMATFERYFIADKATHKESLNPYFELREQEPFADAILREFGLDPERAHIVNGHVPVKVKKGENPVKANGKLLAIDGGFARAYQAQTGIAGYTLVYNSYGLLLSSHEPFESQRNAIEEEVDIDSKTFVLESNYQRIRVRDTDAGRDMKRRIDELQQLLQVYRRGIIKES